MPQPRFCPECGAEYLARATECVDCGVPLVDAEAQPRPPVEQLPPASELCCVRAASIGWAQALSLLLSEAGIAHRVEAAVSDEDDTRQPGATLPFGVYVLDGDFEEASAIDARFTRQQIPDLPEDFGGDEAEGDAESCPACGEALGAEAGECPGCGLVLADDPED
jgi:hypothetical protein